MTTWAYKTFRLDPLNERGWDEQLTELGIDGYELVSVIEFGSQFKAILKKELPLMARVKQEQQTNVVFNEDSLRAAIVGVWGEHGAHADVFDHVVKLARRYVQIEKERPGLMTKTEWQEKKARLDESSY